MTQTCSLKENEVMILSIQVSYARFFFKIRFKQSSISLSPTPTEHSERMQTKAKSSCIWLTFSSSPAKEALALQLYTVYFSTLVLMAINYLNASSTAMIQRIDTEKAQSFPSVPVVYQDLSCKATRIGHPHMSMQSSSRLCMCQWQNYYDPYYACKMRHMPTDTHFDNPAFFLKV